MGLHASARSSIRVIRASRVRETGLVLRRVVVVVVYRRLWRRLNGLNGRSTLGVMASAIVVGLVLRMGVEDDGWGVDLCHLILLQKI